MRNNPVKRLTIKDARRLGICLAGYPSFSATGSVTGMRKLYYGDSARLVRHRGYIYKVPEDVYQRVPG